MYFTTPPNEYWKTQMKKNITRIYKSFTRSEEGQKLISQQGNHIQKKSYTDLKWEARNFRGVKVRGKIKVDNQTNTNISYIHQYTKKNRKNT
ncbi:MAG: hypothetical protein BZ136_09485 [Methanosphaera sp. rholeuAM74]|nr:MAG: hypothetical protein BZ136_09485 [Methanosphaera sp. rholeuAM74]